MPFYQVKAHVIYSCPWQKLQQQTGAQLKQQKRLEPRTTNPSFIEVFEVGNFNPCAVTPIPISLYHFFIRLERPLIK